MTAPIITWYINTATGTTPGWSEILAGHTVKYSGSGLDTPVTAPATGKYKNPLQLWNDDLATGNQCGRYEYTTQEDDYGNQLLTSISKDDYFSIGVDIVGVTNPETSAGKLTLWNTSSHVATDNEILAGTTNMAFCWLRLEETQSNVAHDFTSSDTGIAATYKSQIDTTTTYIYKGATQLTFGAACAAGNENRFVGHCFVPDDSGPGTTGHTWVYTYTYYYT